MRYDSWLLMFAMVFFSLTVVASQSAQATWAPDVSRKTDVDVRGYLCTTPEHTRDFQHLASTSLNMTRTTAVWRFNRTWPTPRCQWYESTHMIYKGVLRKPKADDVMFSPPHLFVGGNGGLFEVLIFETPDGSKTLYSWRRVKDDAI